MNKLKGDTPKQKYEYLEKLIKLSTITQIWVDCAYITHTGTEHEEIFNAAKEQVDRLRI